MSDFLEVRSLLVDMLTGTSNNPSFSVNPTAQ